jgi:hypothetical protein
MQDKAVMDELLVVQTQQERPLVDEVERMGLHVLNNE